MNLAANLLQKQRPAYESRITGATAKSLPGWERDRYEQFLSAFNWKSELNTGSQLRLSQEAVHQLNLGLNQGRGLGSLISVIGLMLDQGQGGFAPEMLELLREQYRSTRNMLGSIREADEIFRRTEPYLGRIAAPRLTEFCAEWRRRLEPMLAIKKQTLLVGALPQDLSEKQLAFECEPMRIVFCEFLINAMKYSQANDEILLLFFKRANFLEVKILNSLGSENPEGISEQHQMKVFQPFFRLTDLVFEDYSAEEFAFGLGLPVARRLLELHGGQVFLFNVVNNCRSVSRREVCLTVRLPLLDCASAA